MKGHLKQMIGGKPLDREEAYEAMNQLLDPSVDSVQAAAFLACLEMRGPSLEELLGFIQALRHRALPVNVKTKNAYIDVCGTGGDLAGTFNISTAVAFVVAGCGVPVAKHGNRSASSRCGSADVWEALRLPLKMSGHEVVSDVDSAGLGFFFAPYFHVALKHLAPIRKAMGIRTIFNLLGPLANPVGVTQQLVGVSNFKSLERVAALLSRSGSERSWVVFGEGGIDEISLQGTTQVLCVEGTKITSRNLIAQDFGKKESRIEHLRGGSASDNAKLIERLLEGSLKGPARDVVEVNAAAALCVAGTTQDLKEGVQLAHEAIETGAAFGVLEDLRQRSA